MRKTILIGAALCILISAAFLSFGDTAGDRDTPEAVYERCQRLQADLDTADAEIRELEYRVERDEKALDNYKYVKEQNAALIERLEEWAASD